MVHDRVSPGHRGGRGAGADPGAALALVDDVGDDDGAELADGLGVGGGELRDEGGPIVEHLLEGEVVEVAVALVRLWMGIWDWWDA